MVTKGVPNDVISNLDPIALIIFIPICDLLIYPALRRAASADVLGRTDDPSRRLRASV